MHYCCLWAVLATFVVYLEIFVLEFPFFSNLFTLNTYIIGGLNILYSNQLLIFFAIFISLYRIFFLRKEKILNILIFLLAVILHIILYINRKI